MQVIIAAASFLMILPRNTNLMIQWSWDGSQEYGVQKFVQYVRAEYAKQPLNESDCSVAVLEAQHCSQDATIGISLGSEEEAIIH